MRLFLLLTIANTSFGCESQIGGLNFGWVALSALSGVTTQDDRLGCLLCLGFSRPVDLPCSPKECTEASAVISQLERFRAVRAWEPTNSCDMASWLRLRERPARVTGRTHLDLRLPRTAAETLRTHTYPQGAWLNRGSLARRDQRNEARRECDVLAGVMMQRQLPASVRQTGCPSLLEPGRQYAAVPGCTEWAQARLWGTAASHQWTACLVPSHASLPRLQQAHRSGSGSQRLLAPG